MEHLTLTETEFFRLISNPDSRTGCSLELLSDAVSFTSRAYIFDNSGHEQVWIAEVTQGVELELKANVMPYWVKTALWDKFSAD
jgi:predicted ABC-type ATPase